MKYFTLALICSTLITGCSSTAIKTLETDDLRECAQNFTYQGTFLSGRTYKTFSFVKNVSTRTAMKRAAQFTVKDGWTIKSTNEKSGIISATQAVNSSRVKTVPLTISIEAKNRGVQVSMTCFLSARLTATLESIKNHFCSTINAIERR
jgi:hypothetical protein